MNRLGRGATLLELMVALAIVAVLASISLPSYRTYTLRVHRGEARAALLSLATSQEAFYLKCNTYSSALDEASATACSPASLNFPADSERGYYSIAVVAADTEAWAVSATAISSGSQFEDSQCRVFRLTSQGVKSASDATGAATGSECWTK